ncbi:hypothetical protein H2198_004926 [Neophaeococcomyces mojaviensis]|uniref:Uncharacterized protein n=1 Tax=Neophaeococcomyces mojaviensis TaxID=3383035 RepID=A0ACC3A729_9EURO|nr:hypothetical protein H2198_004926 [Knufia sp. JES_112]
MSSDSGQWQAPTPGFLFVVEIGDYTHVLKPADQKSADNLKLAQQAEANINMARVLFPQHRDFLLADKQTKMDEVISDSEEAINRVIKLLEPSRVEHITEESVRFNTKSPWALTDDHKTAATFGRLQITHNKLKTVLHELRNIEATAQLDSCEIRANAPINSDIASQALPRRLASTGPKDPAHLLAWRRTQRARSVGSHGSSTISLLSPDDIASGTFSPLSGGTPTGTLLTNATGSAPRFSDADHDNAQRHNAGSDNASEASAERLPVIHELEAVLYGSPNARIGRKQEPKAFESHNDVKPEENQLKSAGEMSRTNTKSTNTSSDVSSVGSPSPRKRKTNHVRMESYADYRRKMEQKRQQDQDHEPKDEITDALKPSLLIDPPAQPTEQYGHNPALPLASAQPATAPSGDAQVAKGLHQESLRSQTAPIAGASRAYGQPSGSSVQQRPVSVAGMVPLGGQQMHGNPEHTRSPMPPRLVSAIETQHGRGRSADQELLSKAPFTPAHLVSPNRLQQSPYEQFQSPLSTPPEPPHPSNAHVSRGLPTILRAAQPKKSETESKAPLPYPVSEAGSDHGVEFPTADLSKLRQVQSAVDRPLIAPPRPIPMPRTTYPPAQATHHMPEPIHNRSASGASIPEISVTRVHTISRKPLPNRGAVASSTTNSNPLRTGAPYPIHERAQSQVPPLTNGIHEPPNMPHAPPSPAVSEDDRRQDRFERNHKRTPSAQHFEPAASEASRRSSVSAEEPYQAPPASKTRPLVTNPLAMHPPPDPTNSPRQNQPLPAAGSEPPKQWQPIQQDYSSPAWQQARHFYPVQQTQQSIPIRQQQSSYLPPSLPPQPHPPVRTQTEPPPLPRDPAFAQGDQQPRRASEQDYLSAQKQATIPYGLHKSPNHATFVPQPASNFFPAQPSGPPPPPPMKFQHQPAQPYMSQQQQQQLPPGNVHPLIPDARTQTSTRTRQPGSIDLSNSLPPSQNPQRADMVGHNALSKPRKDRDLFGHQIFRHDDDKKSVPQSLPPGQFQSQAQPKLALEQRIPNPTYNPRPQSQYIPPAQSPPKPKSPLEQQIPNPIYNRQVSGETSVNIPPGHFQQQNQWQYAMRQSQPLTSITEPPSQEQGSTERSQTPANKPKKRQSWLAHHANKLTAKQSRSFSTTNLAPIMDNDQPLRTQTSAEVVRYA